MGDFSFWYSCPEVEPFVELLLEELEDSSFEDWAPAAVGKAVATSNDKATPRTAHGVTRKTASKCESGKKRERKLLIGIERPCLQVYFDAP